MKSTTISSLLLLALVSATATSSSRAQDGNPVIWEGEKHGTGVLSFSPDGKRIASGAQYEDRSFLWDVAAGKQIAELTDCGNFLRTVSFSADGKWLVTAGLDTERTRWRIVLWNGQTGKRQMELPANLGWRAQFGPGNSGFAVGTLDGPIRFFQVPKGQKVGEFKTDKDGGVDVMVISPDGKLVATARDKTVSLWNSKGGATRGTFAAESMIVSLAFSKDSERLYIGTESGTVTAWGPAKRQTLWSRKVHDDEIRDVAAAPNGAFVATTSRDNTVRFLNPADGKEVRKIEGVAGVTASLAIAPDSKSIAVGHSRGIAIWRTEGGSEVSQAPMASRKRPADAVTVQGHTFALIREHRSWLLAQRRCEDLGGHLATFKTPEQREVVMKLIQEAKESVWLGASDAEEEGKWLWVTGDPVAEQEVSSWSLDNRNDVQHWLCYWYEGMRLDDGYGGERWYFVCEWDD